MRKRGCNSLILRLFAFVCICSQLCAFTCVFGPFSQSLKNRCDFGALRTQNYTRNPCLIALEKSLELKGVVSKRVVLADVPLNRNAALLFLVSEIASELWGPRWASQLQSLKSMFVCICARLRTFVCVCKHPLLQKGTLSNRKFTRQFRKISCHTSSLRYLLCPCNISSLLSQPSTKPTLHVPLPNLTL